MFRNFKKLIAVLGVMSILLSLFLIPFQVFAVKSSFETTKNLGIACLVFIGVSVVITILDLTRIKMTRTGVYKLVKYLISMAVIALAITSGVFMIINKDALICEANLGMIPGVKEHCYDETVHYVILGIVSEMFCLMLLSIDFLVFSWRHAYFLDKFDSGISYNELIAKDDNL